MAELRIGDFRVTASHQELPDLRRGIGVDRRPDLCVGQPLTRRDLAGLRANVNKANMGFPKLRQAMPRYMISTN